MINDFPPLETERLLLKLMTAGDLNFVFRHFSNPDVYRYLVDEEPVTTREQAHEIVDFYVRPSGKTFNRWVLSLKSEKRPIGTCGYHHWHKNHYRAEIGYDLEPESWRQGLMTEALEAVIGFGFEKMELNRISAMVHPGNKGSIHLLEKLGFGKEGLLRDYYHQAGSFYDHWLLSVLKKEWISR